MGAAGSEEWGLCFSDLPAQGEKRRGRGVQVSASDCSPSVASTLEGSLGLCFLICQLGGVRPWSRKVIGRQLKAA